MSDESSEQRVGNGAAWRDFCRALERAGEVVLREGSPDGSLERAEGFRYLSRLTRVALESYVEFADPLFPVLRRPAHETVKIGADNPDNYYQSAALDGRHDYRVSGTRGTVHYLGFGTYAGNYGSKGRSGQTGYVDAKDLEVGPDGKFELILSCNEREGNWLPMEPDTSSLIVRQTFQDREHEEIADLQIVRRDAIGDKPAPLSAEKLDQGLASAAAYVAGTASLFADWAEGFAQRKNELPRFDPAVARAAHGDPNIVYYHGYWELADDESLVIDLQPPQCEYWNFQLNNHWMESLDYRYHRIAVNHHAAKAELDGSVRLIVAHKNPGHPNWIDTAGHNRGTMCLRWVGADEHPTPVTTLKKVSTVVDDRFS